MGYYLASGDYYGVGGFGDFIKGAIRKIGGAIGGAIGGVAAGGPIGGAIGAGAGLLGGPPRLPKINVPFGGPPGAGIVTPAGTPIGIGQPSAEDLRPGGKWRTKDGRWRRIRKDGQPWDRPTMDPGNVRALRRAARRMDRFVSIARRGLRGTRYTVATRGSRKSSKRK